MKIKSEQSPFAISNVRLFIGFRICFNARFYYPVFTILFLDLGLTIEQFALLNTAWAASIVLLEVPSGALADTVGRRNLLVASSVLMVVEMALLCFAPRGNSGQLFAVLLINRILSGAAEASASGADEALAYDTLQIEGNIADWPKVLERQMRLKAVVSMIVMSIGAAVYDPALMQQIVNLCGLKIALTQDVTLRFPVFLTLLMAVLTLIITLRMKETPNAVNSADYHDLTRIHAVFQALRLTLKAGVWILKTPMALVLILSGLLFDHIIRMHLTLNSQYFRLIDLPVASFGLISAGMSVLGLFIPRLARYLAENRSPSFNMYLMAALTISGLVGMTFFIPILGLIPMSFLYAVMLLSVFFLSYYLNRITDSKQRATVLSFKGLFYNLAYGLMGIMYSLLIAHLRSQKSVSETLPIDKAVENTVFIESVGWFPGYFLVLFTLLLVFSWWKLRKRSI
ncbi:MFS transporter [Desulfococcaceae bacterium HSG9]|nr:MFS transporter [Desulfococcaceae bacterium HSG9]